MNLQHRQKDTIHIITLGEQLGLEDVRETREYLEQFIQDPEGQGVILDCSLLAYITSSGIGLIAELYKKLKAQEKNFAMINISDQTREIFDITGFSKFIKIHDTEEQALQAFSAA